MQRTRVTARAETFAYPFGWGGPGGDQGAVNEAWEGKS